MDDEFSHGDGARFAYEYARDEGGLDFMALSPHIVDDRPNDPADLPSMTEAGFQDLRTTAGAVTEESDGITGSSFGGSVPPREPAR